MKINKGTLKAWRLSSQKLGTQKCQTPTQVVEWLGGVQAQDYRWAKWSVGLRTDGCDEEQVESAIHERHIVRTWAFRGTLHFVAASDLGWLTSLLAPNVIRANARRYRQLELGERAFTQSQQVLQHAMGEDGPLTRPQIKAHFEKAGVPAEGQQLPYLLQRAALDGLICQGPLRGKEPTYVLALDLFATQQTLDRTEALKRLAARYFSSHGPATLQDFAWWSGLKAKEVRLAVDAATEVVPIDVDGTQYWASGDPPPGDRSEIACLLPLFDGYLMGYKDRSLALDPVHTKKVNPGGGIPKPTAMLNGEIAGIWIYKVKRDEMLLSIQPFRKLEAQERGLINQAGDHLGHFQSTRISIDFSKSELV